MTATRPKLLEKHIQQQISDLLQLDGWRYLRMEMDFFGKKAGERGMADALYIRYDHARSGCDLQGCLMRRHCEVLWIEHKRPKGKNKDHQKAWQRAERARGALVWVAGEDFEPSLEGFKKEYRESRLCRREGLV